MSTRPAQKSARHPPGLPRRITWVPGLIDRAALRHTALMAARPRARSSPATVAAQHVADVTRRYAWVTAAGVGPEHLALVAVHSQQVHGVLQAALWSPSGCT